MTGEISLMIHSQSKGDAEVRVPFTARSREDLPLIFREAARMLEEAIAKLEDRP